MHSVDGLVEFLRNRDMVEYYGSIQVGSQRQVMDVVFDTGSEVLWIPVIECKACHTKSLFDPVQSQTFRNLSVAAAIEVREDRGEKYISNSISWGRFGGINARTASLSQVPRSRT